ncbi:MAG: alpha/beta hydrolase [Burkholderiales bacterium]
MAGWPTIVFLHEGLGSVSLWRDFPQRVVEETGYAALIYSRYGYGQSDVIEAKRSADYMHREALDVLPELLGKLEIRNPLLFGHSDGASIALIYAGAGHSVRGLILEAPHVFVEDISVQGATKAAQQFRDTDLPKRLSRHHRDADKTFWTWHDIWTSEAFRDWNIEASLSAINCPLLAIQGEQDEYGTLRQIDAIVSQVGGPRRKLVLPNCGHTPHREHPASILEATTSFIESVLQ